MQVIAQAILVLQFTGSALVLGVVTSLQFLPILLLSVFGGVVADSLPRRSVLIVTQTAAMVLAFVLAGLTLAGVVQIWHVAVMATALGIVNAVDMPTRQAFVVDLVPRDALQNAIALNSALFNGSRLLGPAIGGLVVGLVGVGYGFLANAITFVPAIAALLIIRAGTGVSTRGIETGGVWRDLRDGLSYVVRTDTARLVIIVVAVTGLFGMNFNVLVPVMATTVLGVGATGLGVLLAALGIGALAAALGLAFLGWEPHPRLLVGSAAAFGLAEIGLAAVSVYALALPVLLTAGFFMVLLVTLSNIALQTTTPDALRGRVLSVYTTVFAGTTPIGSLMVGAVAEAFGVPAAFILGGVASVGVAVVSGLILLTRRRG